MTPSFWHSYERETYIGLNIKKFDPLVLKDEQKKVFKRQMKSDTNYVLAWYGKIINSSNRKNATKRVVTTFINLNNGYEVDLSLPIDIVLSMPIGSIWRNHKSSEKFVFINYSTVIQDGGFSLFIQSKYTKDLISQLSPIQRESFFTKSHVEQVEVLNELSEEKNLPYAIPLNDYPLFTIKNDGHSLIVIPKNEKHPNLIIHPITFFYAHYGSSKEINRILLNYPWGHEKESNARTVMKLLKLDYYNKDCPEAVFLTDKMVIADAPFLYHIRQGMKNKNGEIKDNSINSTYNRVKHVNAYVSNQMNDNKEAYLEVKPYHSQPIQMAIHGIKLNEDTILCTEIAGISMPDTEEVFYDVNGSINANIDDSSYENQYQSVKVLYQNTEKDEIIIADESVNNLTRAIIRQKPVTIGKIIKISKNADIPIKKIAKRGKTITLTETLPEQFGFGEIFGHGGDVGALQAFLGEELVDELEEQEIDEANLSQYAKLLKHAQILKNSYADGEMSIDCYTFERGVQGEVIRAMTFQQIRTFPTRVFVLRIQVRQQIYFFVDFENMDKYATSGYVFKINDEENFLHDENPFGLRKLVNKLAGNLGRFSKVDRKLLLKNNVVFSQYKHMSSINSNWVKNGLNNVESN